MPKEFFKAIKESVMASNAYGREVSMRGSAYDRSRDEEPRREESRREEPRREEPRREEPWQQRQAVKPFDDSPTEVAAPGHTLSVIGPSLVFKGKLVAEEDLLIQGRVEGSISHNAANLTIGTHGEVKADVVAQKVIIQGAVQGDVRASDTIVVEASARVQGNLFAPRIGLKEGAKFKGVIDMDAAEDASQRAGRKPGAPTPRANAAGSGQAGELSGRNVNDMLQSDEM